MRKSSVLALAVMLLGCGGGGASGDGGAGASGAAGSGAGTGNGGGSGGMPGPPPPPEEGEIEVVVNELDGQATEQTPIQFAHVFREGLFRPGGLSVAIKETDEQLPLQVEVLRSHDDGSIRHAVFATRLPTVAAGSTQTLRFFDSTTVDPAPFSGGIDPSALTVRLELAGSDAVVAELSDYLVDPTGCTSPGTHPGDSAQWRFQGGVLRQCVTWGRARDEAGGTHPQIDVSFRVSTYSGWDGALVDVVVENTHPTTGNDVSFDSATLTVGANATWQRDRLVLSGGTRFRVLADVGTPVPRLEKQWNLRDLVNARAVNMLNVEAMPLEYDHIAKYLRDKEATIWTEPNEFGPVVSAMPTTGNRGDIGPIPRWDKIFLATMNRDALRHTEGINSNAFASNYDVHYRETSEPGAPIGLVCGPDSRDQQRDLRASHDSAGRPDTAHQPRIGFVPYLVTGDLYHFEQMQFWGHYSHNRDPRIGGRCVVSSQGRATAWAGFRLHSDLAFLVPDDHRRKAYYEEILDGMLEWTADITIRKDPALFPNHPVEGNPRLQNSGRATYVNARRHSPWAYSWQVWAVQVANRRGTEKARPLAEWFLQYIVDAYTVETDDSHAFIGPDGNEYRYLAEHAMSYDMALTLLPDLQPCVTPEGQLPDDVGRERPFSNWGELFYWSLVNHRHKNNPAPVWCPPDRQVWSPDNGNNTDPPNDGDWHEYGGEPGAVAVAEAFMDNHSTRRVALPKSMAAYERQTELRIAEQGDGWERLIAVPLP